MSAAYVTRVYRFCAGHRLFHPARDDEWNQRVFGKCSTPGGHGHNYTLEVTVRGTPDRETGWIIAPQVLDRAVEAVVFDGIDHRNLNDVLGRDFGPAPTTEVLLLELWRSVEPRIAPPARLFRLRLGETAKNSFEYCGP